MFATASETVTLTLENAVILALEQSINLKKNSIDLAQTGYSANRLWSEIFPGFSISAGLTFLPSTPLVTGPGFQYRDDALSYSLNFGLSLSLNPSFYSSMKRIELAYRSQLLSYENASKQLEIQVIKNFLGLITMKANISHMQESLDLAIQKMNSDRIARANGVISELVWLNSQLSAETARYNLSNAQGLYQNALGEFLALLGMQPGSDIIFDGTVEIAPVHLDPEQLIIEYLPKRPDIVSQRQTIERLELTKNITTHSSRSPTLSLSTQWRGTPESGGLNAPLTDSLSGSLTLTVPIDSWIPGTRQNQSVRSAGTELEKARLDLQNTETQAKTQIRTLVMNLRNTWENLGIARMRVDVATRTVEATNHGFRNGTVEFRELEDRRNDLGDARQRLLSSELNYQSLLLDLAAALNVEWKSLTGLIRS
jgi:outer membrane protein TolC